MLGKQPPRGPDDAHAQARRVIAGRPEQHVVVEILFLAQVVGALHVREAAQDDCAVRVRMHRLTLAIQTQVVALGLFQRSEREHQHIRPRLLEFFDDPQLVHADIDRIELVAQQTRDQLRIGQGAGSNKNTGSGIVHC